MKTGLEVPHLARATERVRLFADAVQISRLTIPLVLEDGQRTRNPLEILDVVQSHLGDMAVKSIGDDVPSANHKDMLADQAHNEQRLIELGLLAEGSRHDPKPYFVR